MARTPKPSNTAPDAGGPTQTPKTGGGAPQTGLAPKPRHAPTTGPKIASPSVDYDHRQSEAPTTPTHLGASGQDYQAQQQQEKKRR